MSAALRGVAAVLAGSVTLLALAWAADLPRILRWALYTEQFLAAMLGLSLGLVFLHVRAGRGTGGPVPWYDLCASLLGLGAGAYLAVTYPTIAEELAFDPTNGIVVAGILLVLVIEGLRRAAGPALALIVVGFLVYGLFGYLVPGRLTARHVEVARLLTELMLDTNGLLGIPLVIATSVVVTFVFFGHVLNRCGGSVFFTDVSSSLMGGFRGGAAKIAIIASSLFGSISGSAVSNVATTGIVTIPLMRKAGFSAATASGIEAVASTGGQLMPPIMGASAFLMAEFLQIPYRDVVLAALAPAILYYLALFIQVDLRAAKAGIARMDKAEIPPFWPTLAKGWFFPVPFFVLVAALFLFNAPPEKAGLEAALATLGFGFVFGYARRRLTIRDLLGVVRDVGTSVVDIILITAAAGLIIGVLNLTGLSFGLTLVLVELSSKTLMILLVTAAGISIILGMGMPTIGVYVLLAALVAPSMVERGVEPIAAHLFVLYFGMMSMITPPVAIAAFAAASLGRADPLRTALEAMRLGWPAYVVPFLFVMSPSLLFIGDGAEFAVAFVTAVGGVWLVSIGLVGYLVRPLTVVRRLLFALAGLALMMPAGVFEGALVSDAVGAALGLALIGREIFLIRAVKRVPKDS